MKPGARIVFRISNVGAGYQGFGPSFTAFAGHQQRAAWELEIPGSEPTPVWNPGMSKVRALTATLSPWAHHGILKQKEFYSFFHFHNPFVLFTFLNLWLKLLSWINRSKKGILLAARIKWKSFQLFPYSAWCLLKLSKVFSNFLMMIFSMSEWWI